MLSQRYLRSRMVNIIAIIAVNLGVTALILVSSVMNGFARDIEDRIRGIMSHIVVDSEQLVGIDDYEHLISRIEKVPGVSACSPVVESPFVLIRVGNETRIGQIRGIDPDREKQTTEIAKYLKDVREQLEADEALRKRIEAETNPKRRHTLEKEFDRNRYMAEQWLAKKRLDFNFNNGEEPPHPGALVGIEMAARSLGVVPGQTIAVTSPTTILTFQTKEFTVVGGFRCRHWTYDSQLVYVPLQAAQDLLGLPGRVTSISVRLDDISRAEKAKKAIHEAIRNIAPIIDPGSPAVLDRIAMRGGSVTVQRDKAGPWLKLVSEGAGPAKQATLVIHNVAAILKKADHPTTLTFTFRAAAAAGLEPAAWFEIMLVNSAGRTFYADPELRRLYPGVLGEGEAVTLSRELANFVSADGLDLLDPADIDKLVVEVHHGAVELGSIGFEDNRRLSVSTWRDKQRSFLRAVEVERYIQVIIMGLMVVIAGFSIMAILWLMVREKTRDIGILMALGATRVGIVKIFLMNGLLIGFVGGALGLVTGWVMSANLNAIEDFIDRWFGLRVFPPDIYYLDRLPHVENPVSFVAMALIAVAVSLVAALWPAFKAARLDPIEALRYE